MKISLAIPNNHKVTTLLQPWQEEVGGPQIGAVAALADRLGFSRLTVGEHFLMPGDHVAASGAHYVDAPTALAYLAGHTTRIRLASNVALPAPRHPVVQAKQWAVLDWLSGGRADLMAGVGWLREEFEVLGVDFRTRGRCLGRAEAAPAGRGPVLVRGRRAPDLRPGRPWGAGWSPYLIPPERIAAGLEQIRLHPGYRGQPVEVFYNLANLRLSEGHQAKADDHDFDTWNVQQLVDQIGWIGGLGVTEVTPPLPRLASYRHFLERLHWLAEEVMPRVA